MAATPTVVKRYSLGRTGELVIFTVLLDNSYVGSTGEPFTLTDVEYVHDVLFANSSGYSFELGGTKVAPTVIAKYVDNNAAADSAQIDVPATTDLSAVTVRGWAITG